MTEDLGIGFTIKSAIRDARDRGEDVSEAVQRTLADLDIGNPRGGRGDDLGGGNDGDNFDVGRDGSDSSDWAL